MSREAGIAAQKSVSENINAVDLDAAMQSFAGDAVDHDPARGQASGREGFNAFFTEAECNGIAPTGKTIEVRGLQIGRFENGQIVERRGSSDELRIMQQLGADVAPKSGLAKLAERLEA